jgi:hypothetical protein
MDSFAPINPALLDVKLPPSGYSDAHKANDTRDVLFGACGAAARDFPQAMWIEPKDWADKARDNDKYKTWGMNYLDRYTNQNPTHECTTHSLRANCEAARNRQRGIIFPEGPKANFRYDQSATSGSVWLSPLSVYAEANPAQWGGANVQQVLEIAARRGMLPDKIQPRDYGFKHQLQGTTGEGNSNQASGPWVKLANFPSGWQETAKWFMPQEVVFPDSWEQAVCMVLHGCLVGVGRSGHAISWAQLSFEGSNLKAAAYPDSYNVTRYDSVGTMRGCGGDGSFSVVSMTAPDDWNHPAGGVS